MTTSKAMMLLYKNVMRVYSMLLPVSRRNSSKNLIDKLIKLIRELK